MSKITLTLRKFPKAYYDFLRFQLGRWEMRAGSKFYKDDNGHWHESPIGQVPVFRLLGFGSTLEKAANMAKECESRQEAAVR